MLEWYVTPMHNVIGMTVNEVKMAEKYISGKNNVLEWGSGGSTLHFPSMINGKYVSIEHNEGWYNKIKPQINKNVEFYLEKPTYVMLDDELDNVAHQLLRNTKDSYERDDIKYWNCRGGYDWHQAVPYIRKPEELGLKYDVIFIDGRCRKFCAYVAQKLINPDGYVIIHDFNPRQYYHTVLDYYDVVEKEDTLVVLQLKK